MLRERALRRLRQITTASLLPLLIATGWAQNAPPPKYSADVPSDITTPDSVETRIGTLRFNNGVPDQRTIQMVYDEIDFARGIETFLTGMSATSVYALCEGLDRRNQGIGITEDLMDARSLFLTPNTTTVYVFCLPRPKQRTHGAASAPWNLGSSRRCLFSLGNGCWTDWSRRREGRKVSVCTAGLYWQPAY